MALPPMTLSGTATDRLSWVQCELTFDPTESRIEAGPLGRMLALSATAKMSLVCQLGSTYQGGEARLLGLHGWLGLQNSTWGAAIPQHTVTYSQPESRIALYIPFSDSDIEAVETARAAGDVQFELFLAGTAEVAVTTATPVQIQQGQPPVRVRLAEVVPISLSGAPSPTHSSFGFRIPREHWLGMLARAGRRRHLLELPVPDLPEGRERWLDAIRHLQEATGAHRTGRFEDALKDCRQVVEGIAMVLAHQWNVRKDGKSYDAWVKELVGRLKSKWPDEDKGQVEMIGALLGATWAWTSPSHHYGTGVPIREEAAFAVHLATALLSFAAQLLQAHPQPVAQPEG